MQMSPQIPNLWTAWRSSPAIEEVARTLVTSEHEDGFHALLHSNPDQAAAVLFAAMQFTTDRNVLSRLAAGPLEVFLNTQGEGWLDRIYMLALEHERLRDVLVGTLPDELP